MKAISKKLLSLLVVIAMVLSMVPFGGLSIFAVETKAALTETEQTAVNKAISDAAQVQLDAAALAAAGFPAGSKCPACGKTVTEWIAKTGRLGSAGDIQDGGHYYFSAGSTQAASWNFLQLTGSMSACLHLNGQTINHGGRIHMGSTGTLNIMGTGTMNSYSNYNNSVSYGHFQITGAGTVNLYGGTYTMDTNHENSSPLVNPTDRYTYYANLGVMTAATVNIYPDVVLESNGANVTAVSGATINMYGGEIRNGQGFPYHYEGTPGASSTVDAPATDKTWVSAGGNVYMRSTSGGTPSTFNMYGGTISGGNVGTSGSFGGNVFVYTNCSLNIYNGAQIIQDTETAVASYGGNISSAGSSTITVDGGIVTGGMAGRGGNIDLAGAGKLYIYDGEVSYGEATGNGGNIYAHNPSAVIEISGGKVKGGQAKNGGSLYIAKCSDLQITGTDTLITGGIASAAGGNLYLSGVTCNIGEGVTISEGKATTYGGNICAQQNGTEGADDCLYSSITTAGKIIDGQLTDGSVLTASGGNISITARTTLTVNGGEIARGVLPVKTDSTATQTGWGGNIRAWNSNVTITGGSIYAGDQAKNCSSGNKTAANIGCMGDADHKTAGFVKLAVTGGTITGDVMISATQTSVSVSGDAKIVKSAEINGTTYTANYNGLFLSSDSQVTVGSLNDGAEICVSGNLNRKINVADAAVEAQADHFTAYATNRQVLWDADNNVLYIAEKVAEPEVGVFDPESFGGKAYCPVCYANGTHTDPVEWTAFTGTGSNDIKNQHWYLAGDITSTAKAAINLYSSTSGDALTGCFNLNGHTLSMAGRVSVASADETLNIMDTSSEKTGVLESTGANKVSNELYGHTLVAMNGGKIVLYGGTFKNTDSTAGNVVLVNDASSSITIKDGAVIDAAGAKYGVNVAYGPFVMDGGQINGGSTNTACVTVASGKSFTMNGGTIDGKGLVRSVETSGTFTMNGGTIQNGIAANGGNVLVNSGSTFTMNSGIIKDGKATNTETVSWVVAGGGNIYSLGNVTLNGGTVQDGKACGTGGNIHCAGGTLTIGDGTATTTEITVSGGKTGVTIGEATLANGYGGNIGVTAGTATVKAGALITDGSTNSESAKGGYGGNIYTYGGAKVYMQGGTVTKGTSGRGGNFDMNNGTVEISGGIVSNGTSTSGGAGNVYVQNKGTLKIYGNAHLIGGQATNGGSIRHTGTAAQLVISGGIIEGGNATQDGGNIYSDAANGVKISDNAEIKLGNAQKNGGNIFIDEAGELEMTGGTVTGGKANWTRTENTGDYEGSYTYKNGEGGNIYSNGTLTFKGGTVSNGTAGCYGGNIMVSGGTFTVLAADSAKPVQFTGGQTQLFHGGNLCLSSATVSIDGAAITGGTAGDGEDYNVLSGTTVYHGTTGQGGNMRIFNSTDFEIKNSTVSGGSAVGGNPNIWIYQATVTLENTQVVGVDGAYRGSGVCVAKSGDTLTIKGTTSITNANNNALRMVNGGILVVEDGWSGNVGVHFEEKAYSVGETVNNASCTGDYTGTLMNGNGDKVAIIADGTNLVLAGYAVVDTDNDTTTWSTTADLEAVNGSETKYLLAADKVTLNDETVYIDALTDIEVTVNGNGKAYGIDIANGEDYANASTGSFSGNVQNDATFNEVRYIKIDDGTVHAIEMGIKSISLRTGACGLYYKAYYECDEALAKAITAYGVVLSTKDMPGTDWAPTDLFSLNENFVDPYDETTHKLDNVTSVSVFGIMKDDLEAAENKARGEMPIYANAYILVNNAEIFVGDTANKDKKVTDGDWDDAGVALSLRDVMDMVNTNWNSLTTQSENLEQIQKRVKEFYTEWYDLGMSEWEFSNITKIVTA